MTQGNCREIKITDIEGFRIGQTEDNKAGTGCTVIISENGAAAGVDIRGGGPASRECELLRPFSVAGGIHALSNGSIEADQDLVGTLAARVMSMAIVKAVKSAESAFGFPAYDSIR